MRKILFSLIALALGCGYVAAQVPRSSHVVLIVEENHSYDSVIGQPSMPYLNKLAAQGGLATAYYANTHPSIGNYFFLTTGQLITNDDGFNDTVDADNLVRQFKAAGVSWRSYAQSLPSRGYTGPDKFPYLRRHNPFSYFSDVANDGGQRGNLVPLEQLRADIEAHRLPNFAYVVPDARHDAHNCPSGSGCPDEDMLRSADDFLAGVVPELLASPDFRKDGVLIIVFDESFTDDKAHGGGHIPMVVVGRGVKPGFRSTRLYQQPATERLICEALGLGGCPGAGASAPSMAEFFGR